MARRRFQRSRRLNRSPSAFAPGRLPGGRALTWESLIAPEVPQTLDTWSVSNTNIVDQRLRAILPANVTRGVVTIERIRGFVQIWFEDVAVDAAIANWTVDCSIQVIGARAGSIDLGASLDSTSAFDLESNKFMWRASYSAPVPSLAANLHRTQQNVPTVEIDVKSRRRVDRATWGVAFTLQASAASRAAHKIRVDLRALLRASDGA